MPEQQMPDLGTREVRYTTTATTEIPRAKCSRCEDWTTVVYKDNKISPCPVCCPAEYAAWDASGGRVPAS